MPVRPQVCHNQGQWRYYTVYTRLAIVNGCLLRWFNSGEWARCADWGHGSNGPLSLTGCARSKAVYNFPDAKQPPLLHTPSKKSLSCSAQTIRRRTKLTTPRPVAIAPAMCPPGTSPASTHPGPGGNLVSTFTCSNLPFLSPYHLPLSYSLPNFSR